MRGYFAAILAVAFFLATTPDSVQARSSGMLNVQALGIQCQGDCVMAGSELRLFGGALAVLNDEGQRVIDVHPFSLDGPVVNGLMAGYSVAVRTSGGALCTIFAVTSPVLRYDTFSQQRERINLGMTQIRLMDYPNLAASGVEGITEEGRGKRVVYFRFGGRGYHAVKMCSDRALLNRVITNIDIDRIDGRGHTPALY